MGEVEKCKTRHLTVTHTLNTIKFMHKQIDKNKWHAKITHTRNFACPRKVQHYFIFRYYFIGKVFKHKHILLQFEAKSRPLLLKYGSVMFYLPTMARQCLKNTGVQYGSANIASKHTICVYARHGYMLMHRSANCAMERKTYINTKCFHVEFENMRL